MKIENNIIKEATTTELFSVYLKNEYDDIMSFDEYLELLEERGVRIVGKTNG